MLLFFLILTGFFNLVYCANSPGNEDSEQPQDQIDTNILLIKRDKRSKVERMSFDQAIVKFCKHEAKKEKCLCKAAAFRIAQICCLYTRDSIFSSYDIKKIRSGWNADGPRGLFVKKLGVPAERFSITEDATPTNDLTLEDSWFEIEFKNGTKLKIRGTDRIYTDEYLELRRKYKKGDKSVKAQFAEEKKKVEHNLRELPFRW